MKIPDGIAPTPKWVQNTFQEINSIESALIIIDSGRN